MEYMVEWQEMKTVSKQDRSWKAFKYGKELIIHSKSKWWVFYGFSLGQENFLLRFTVRKNHPNGNMEVRIGRHGDGGCKIEVMKTN